MMGWIGGGPRPWQQQTQLIWMPSGESSSKRALTSARSVTTWRSRETSVLVSPRIASSARVTMVVQRHRPVRLGERAEDPDLDGADRDVAAALPKAAGAVGLEPVQAGRSVAAAVVCAPRLFAGWTNRFTRPRAASPGRRGNYYSPEWRSDGDSSMISILSQLATWSRDQPLGEAFSRVFSSRLRSANLDSRG